MHLYVCTCKYARVNMYKINMTDDDRNMPGYAIYPHYISSYTNRVNITLHLFFLVQYPFIFFKRILVKEQHEDVSHAHMLIGCTVQYIFFS